VVLYEDLILAGVLTGQASQTLFENELNLQMLPGYVLSVLGTHAGLSIKKANSPFMQAMVRILSKATTVVNEYIGERRRRRGRESGNCQATKFGDSALETR
jgi:hypothetical protein